MNRELKALLFTLFMLIFVGSFTIQWAYTGSIVDALVFVGQVALLFISIIVLFVVFMLIGLRIFHE